MLGSGQACGMPLLTRPTRTTRTLCRRWMWSKIFCSRMAGRCPMGGAKLVRPSGKPLGCHLGDARKQIGKRDNWGDARGNRIWETGGRHVDKKKRICTANLQLAGRHLGNNWKTTSGRQLRIWKQVQDNGSGRQLGNNWETMGRPRLVESIWKTIGEQKTRQQCGPKEKQERVDPKRRRRYDES